MGKRRTGGGAKEGEMTGLAACHSQSTSPASKQHISLRVMLCPIFCDCKACGTV